jgi:hypothetical protein
MYWKRIIKDKAKQPKGNDYTKWKEQIAEECYKRCVYCSIHEAPWGGIDHYHIDHYRPKSKPEFKEYELDICNLFYACPICNRFKSDDWPNEPNDELNRASYPDPSQIDYASIFYLDTTNFKLKGTNVAANYVIERLYLNRPQLIYERREDFLRLKDRTLRNEVLKLSNELNDENITQHTLIVVNRLLDLLHHRNNISPYKISEIRKP